MTNTASAQPLTERESRYVALRQAARDLYASFRHLPFRDPAREAAREAVTTLQRAAADVAAFPPVGEGLELGRTKNAATGRFSYGLYYTHDARPAGHDGYIGHFLKTTPFGDTPADDFADFEEGDDLGYLRHMDALLTRLAGHGLL